MARLIDANLIIRYITQDDQEKALAVKKLLQKDKQLIIPDMVVAEIIWTLVSFYYTPKEEAVEKILSLLAMDNIEANKELLNKSLNIFQKNNIDYIDAYLAAFCEEGNLEGIYSYDHDFDKIKGIARKEP